MSNELMDALMNDKRLRDIDNSLKRQVADYNRIYDLKLEYLSRRPEFSVIGLESIDFHQTAKKQRLDMLSLLKEIQDLGKKDSVETCLKRVMSYPAQVQIDVLLEQNEHGACALTLSPVTDESRVQLLSFITALPNEQLIVLLNDPVGRHAVLHLLGQAKEEERLAFDVRFKTMDQGKVLKFLYSSRGLMSHYGDPAQLLKTFMALEPREQRDLLRQPAGATFLIQALSSDAIDKHEVMKLIETLSPLSLFKMIDSSDHEKARFLRVLNDHPELMQLNETTKQHQGELSFALQLMALSTELKSYQPYTPQHDAVKELHKVCRLAFIAYAQKHQDTSHMKEDAQAFQLKVNDAIAVAGKVLYPIPGWKERLGNLALLALLVVTTAGLGYLALPKDYQSSIQRTLSFKREIPKALYDLDQVANEVGASDIKKIGG
ncbi:MAG: hypothetical protein ACOYKA_01960 [Legionellaceae bacterium]